MTMRVLPASRRRIEDFEQGGDVGEVQAGGRFVEQVEGIAGGGLAEFGASLMRCASPPESVVADWPRLDVAEADVAQGLQALVNLREHSEKRSGPRRRSCRGCRRCSFRGR